MKWPLVLVVVIAITTAGSVVQADPLLHALMPEGVAGIHGTPTPPFPVLADGHHVRWFGLDEDLTTPGITDVSYSFTWTADVIAFFGGADVSTADQMARVRDSFDAWEAVTPGLKFFEKAGTATISAGTAASFASTGFGTALGLGGGLSLFHNTLGGDSGVDHHLNNALAVQRATVDWHNGAGSPAGTGKFDYLTVATQEDGHAFGLGHNAGDATSVMFPFLGINTRLTPNGADAASSNFLYPVTAVPEPSTLVLLLIGGLGLVWQRRQNAA